MTNLGSFGAAVRELDPDAEKDAFDFFDEKFIVHGILPPVLMLQLGAATTGKIDEQEGLGAIWEALRCCLTKPETVGRDGATVEADPSQFQRFYKLAVSKVCDLEELIRLTMVLFERQAGRPTGERPSSSAGPLTTSPNLNGSSSTPPALPGYTRVADVLAG